MAAAAMQLLRQTLDAELDPGVRLSAVRPGQRLVEMEFTLPVQQLDVARLRAVLADPAHGLAEPLRQAAAGLDFHTVRGYLKGFIDLVFAADGRFIWWITSPTTWVTRPRTMPLRCCCSQWRVSITICST
jgi:exodeoxyribonuclease V beta subunit